MARKIELTQAKDPYRVVHYRLRTTRGPAREHDCHDCGQPATEWSLQSPEKCMGNLACVRRPNGQSAVWISDDLGDYVPRDTACHKAHDKAVREQQAGAA